MSVFLECRRLTKRYGKFTALDSIDLTLESGKIIGLLGPNGSGKTTLIKLINGLLVPESGSVAVCGQAPGVQTKQWVSYLPDTPFLNEWMSVRQIVTLFGEFYADFRAELAYEMLAKLDITPKTALKQLSKGNREKVSLILTMSRNALLYVLDEPIAGVDPATRDYIIATILANYNPDASVLIATHLIADVEEVLDDVIFLKQGHIELHETVDSIRQQHGMSVDALFREVFKW